MQKRITSFVGLDVHQDSIAVAVAPTGSEEPRFVGTVAPQWAPLCKALSRLGRREELQIVYEAGPCGYPLARQLRAHGYACNVIAPSKVARRPGDRIKTDRRDALLLSRAARGVLIEAAWNYRFPARISEPLQRRQEGQPKTVREIAWRAQLRLARRYRHLSARKLALNKICVAVARELSAFVWDIARQVKPTARVPSDNEPTDGNQEVRASDHHHHHRTNNARVTRCASTDEGNPRRRYVGIRVMIPDPRARQPRDGQMNCGNQPADISMIHRRRKGSRVACPLRC